MKDYQPQTADLLNLGIELIESDKIKGIKSYVDLTTSRMIAEIYLENEIKLVGTRLIYPSGNEQEDLKSLEQLLTKEIQVYLLLCEVLEKAKKLN